MIPPRSLCTVWVVAAVHIFALYCASSFGQGPAHDLQITQEIQNVLRADFRLRAEGIDVSSVAGRVTLKGRVTSYHNRQQAEQLAKRVEGVRSIVNLIKVEPALQKDHRIADDVRGQLRRHAFVEFSEIEVAVDNGVVTLSGQIRNWAQAHEAETVAGQIHGVVSVRNDLTYAAANRRSDEDIRQDVTDELHRDALLSDLPIDVRVVHNVVTLKGDVPSLYHKDRVEEKVRLVTLVKEVHNQLEVWPQVSFEQTVGRPEDGEIAEFVRQELHNDPRVAAGGISLDVARGKVKLRGEVASLYEKQMAERIARRVIGVFDVDNHLLVAQGGRNDEEIQRDVAEALSSDAVLRGKQLIVAVHDGRVNLRGEVSDFTSKAQAVRLTQRIRGVRSIDNEVKVAASARLSDGTVTSLVVSRLKGNTVVRDVADRIDVRTADGVVRLNGTVRTTGQRAEAGRAAFLTDGVKAVENHLKVMGR